MEVSLGFSFPHQNQGIVRSLIYGVELIFLELCLNLSVRVLISMRTSFSGEEGFGL